MALKLKDESDPVFTTHQTDSMFILTSHLKAYGRRDIKIEINEDGSRITISGEKPVQETTMVKCEIIKKQVEMMGFCKTFKIPEGVILDKIKARFDQDESRLTIRMPKSVKGVVVGIGIQEFKDVEDLALNQENHEMKNEEIVGSSDLKQEEDDQHVTKLDELKPENKIQSEKEDLGEGKGKQFEENDIQEAKPPEKSSIICTPIIVGSALFASFIVVVLSLLRSKKDSRERRN